MNWAAFYSYSKAVTSVQAFLYTLTATPRRIQVSVPAGEVMPPLALPPDNFPNQVVRRTALFSSPVTGFTRSPLLYLVDYPTNGGLQLHWYNVGTSGCRGPTTRGLRSPSVPPATAPGISVLVPDADFMTDDCCDQIATSQLERRKSMTKIRDEENDFCHGISPSF